MVIWRISVSYHSGVQGSANVF